MNKLFLFLCLVIGVISCQFEPVDENELELTLNSESIFIRNVVDSTEKYEPQILYSEIQKNDTTGEITFVSESFRLDSGRYFYPASTVKLPIAILALEKAKKSENYSSTTPFQIIGDTVVTTIRNEIRKIFAVSDNAASNRLFEFMGQDYINSQLKSKGVKAVRISHRLSTENADTTSTYPVILNPGNKNSDTLQAVKSGRIQPLDLSNIKQGKGYIRSGKLINGPMDFSYKNYFSVSAMDGVLKRIIYPEAFPVNEIFDIEEADRDYLLNTMKSYPRQLGYDKGDYFDSYSKFFIYGNSEDEIRSNIEIFNKVGYAYGQVTDCAYIRHSDNNVEFFLTATLRVNKNMIYNDDTYEFEEFGVPFLSVLGQKLYDENTR